MNVIDRFVAIAPVEIRMHQIADDRARPDDRDLDHEIVSARYDWIDRHIDRFSGRERPAGERSWTDRIDGVLLP